jgi:hypothetical protein
MSTPPAPVRNYEDEVDIPEMDELYLKQWSCVPISCRLAPADSLSPDKDEAINFICPRQSFLYYYTDSIKDGFGNRIKQSGNVWYSYCYGGADLPLPVQYPVSVLYDIIVAETRPSGRVPPLPLPLVVHFSEAKEPSKQAPAAAGTDAVLVSSHFLAEKERLLKTQSILSLPPKMGYQCHRQIVKASLQCCFGNSDALNTLEKELPSYAKGMFHSVRNNDPEGHWKARCALLYIGSVLSGQATDFTAVVHQDGRARYIKCPPGLRLGSFLKEYVPAFKDRLEGKNIHANQQAPGVTIQGMRPFYSTPMQDLFEIFLSVDFALHIVIATKKDLDLHFNSLIVHRSSSAPGARRE